MPLLKIAICNLPNKRILKLFSLFLILTLLTIVYSPLSPVSLVSTNLRVYNVFSVVARNLGENQLAMEDDHSHYKTRTTVENSSLSRTSQPDNDSLAEPQKTLHIYDYIINEPNKCQGEVPFLALLITVERRQKEARQAIRQAWGQEDFVPGVKILRLFLLGKDVHFTNEDQQDLLRESQEYHDIIQQDYLDTYRNLTTKVLMGLHWVATYCPKASYVMKTDSDMFVNTEYLIKTVLKPDQPRRQNYFTGDLMVGFAPYRDKGIKWYVSPEEYPEESYPLFCSGTGYVFSADLACKIVMISPTVRWLYLEDVFVGLCLKKLGMEPVAPPKDSDFNHGNVEYSDCKYNQIVTAHELSPEEIIHCWNKLQQNKHTCKE
ncbi:beta-1,3-galactosyltransferase 2-like [Hyperolius riggenbachi]|uniref:beta-1,3-galactosyltransferase 2-like n=1 Tax=Hyperolius riggenbachi TaxID=752182 RepID=UPI0035A26F01